jgi:hypothetical protein
MSGTHEEETVALESMVLQQKSMTPGACISGPRVRSRVGTEALLKMASSPNTGLHQESLTQ